jgi:hypothetical protein
MTAITLFREPSFEKSLQRIESCTVIHALLANIVAFSSRFCCCDDSEYDTCTREALATFGHAPSHFINLASRFIDRAMEEFDHLPPPLSLLQAAVLLAHGQLSQGVQGKAWRSLGICVRVAYQLNLHLLDSGHVSKDDEVDVEQWCNREEKRRAWWAVWEMDVFASTIRRCPTAIDWSQNETLLPIDDESWFRGKPRASCFLELDLTHRWSVIQRSGNLSAKAWFIVINSLMKDAQCISSLMSTRNPTMRHNRGTTPNTSKQQQIANGADVDGREKLKITLNSVHWFILALPASLRFRNQYLGFDARQSGQTISARQDHFGIYSIYVMTQLALLMIHQYDVPDGPIRTRWAENRTYPWSTAVHRGDEGSWRLPRGNTDANVFARDQYLDAADNILAIVHSSCGNHIKWINAYLASTIWLAAAIQLVHKEFGLRGMNKAPVKSKFDDLYMTYKKCASYWDIQTALQPNLESLESQLNTIREENKSPVEARTKTRDHRRVVTKKESWMDQIQDQSNARGKWSSGLITNIIPLIRQSKPWRVPITHRPLG